MTRALSKRTVLSSALVICPKPVYRLIGFPIAYHGPGFPLRPTALPFVTFGSSRSAGETTERRQTDDGEKVHIKYRPFERDCLALQGSKKAEGANRIGYGKMIPTKEPT